MKASEFMIGDLVIFEDCVHKITDLSLCIDGTVLVHVDGLDCHIFEHEIHAIPLTEEILKANGFESIEQGSRTYLFRQKDREDGTELYNIEVVNYHDTPDYYFVDVTHDNVGFARKKIKYVHHIQGILRTCDLWDIAEKFKIN